jgi:hypothetical protein
MDTTIKVGINDEVIELTGKEKEDFLAQRELDTAEVAAMEQKAQAKVDARQSALAKLAAIGLTQEEIEAL